MSEAIACLTDIRNKKDASQDMAPKVEDTDSVFSNCVTAELKKGTDVHIKAALKYKIQSLFFEASVGPLGLNPPMMHFGNITQHQPMPAFTNGASGDNSGLTYTRLRQLDSLSLEYDDAHMQQDALSINTEI